MEKAVKELAEKVEQGASLTESAQRIARVAIDSFNHELLDKALDIVKAIIHFEDELSQK